MMLGGGNSASNGVIKTASILGFSVVLRTISIFFSWQFLYKQDIPIFVYAFFVFALSSCALCALHRPWTRTQGFSGKHIRIFGSSGCLLALSFVFFSFGLKYIGALKALLLLFSELSVLHVLSVWSNVNLSGRKHRGVILMSLGYLYILFSKQPEGSSNVFDFWIIEVSASFLGTLSIIVSGILAHRQRKHARKSIKEIGGPKRFHTLCTLAGTIFLFPFSLIHFFSLPEDNTISFFSGLSITFYLVASLFYVILGNYISSFGMRVVKYSSLATQIQVEYFTGVICGIIFYLIRGEEELSLAILICSFLIGAGLSIYLHSDSHEKLLPQFSRPKTQHAMLNPFHMQAKIFLKHIREDRSSLRILIFLTLNFSFMFMEFIYGFATNSLGLMSDACHMWFDCVALAIGLYAAYMSKVKTDKVFTYGYGRIKVLAGFINGIFLVFIAFSVFVESVERLLHPPDIETPSLIVVSTIGLLVNLVGLFFFQEEHHAGHSHEGHSHGHDGHHHHEHDTNMEAMFLHVLADTLGSVGVIVSSLLIHWFDWKRSDPVCSVFISLLILMTVWPLIKESCQILLQRTPDDILPALKDELQMVCSIQGVRGYRNAHFWEFTPGKTVASVHLQVEESADAQSILNHASATLKDRFDLFHLTIQIEKEPFLNTLEPSKSMDMHIPLSAGKHNK